MNFKSSYFSKRGELIVPSEKPLRDQFPVASFPVSPNASRSKARLCERTVAAFVARPSDSIPFRKIRESEAMALLTQ